MGRLQTPDPGMAGLAGIGVEMISSRTHNHSYGSLNGSCWVIFTFHDVCLIDTISLAGLHSKSGDDSMKDWRPTYGANATIELSSSSTFGPDSRIGVVPQDFGQQLVDGPGDGLPPDFNLSIRRRRPHR